MKKEYDAPKAEIVNFDYTETVVASNTVTSGSKCPDPCGKPQPSFWFGWCK